MSPQSNPPQPTVTPSPAAPAQTPEQMEQELTMLRRQHSAMSQMIWELVRAAAPEEHQIEISPIPSDALWQLAFVKSSDPASGKVRILAGTRKPISEQEKKRVVRLLRGTSTPMHEALKKLKLEFPAAYVEDQIKTHIRWEPTSGGLQAHWRSVTLPSLGEKAKNFIGLPK